MWTKRSSVITLLASLACAIGAAPAALAAEPPVRAVAESWPPYMGSELPDEGFIPELVKEALNKSGYTVKTDFIAWAKAVSDVETGKADLLYGVYKTDEREKFLKFSPPIAAVKNVLFAKKGKNISFKQVADLKPYQIGIIRGAAHGKEFDEATNLNKVEVVDGAQNIEKLAMGRIDLMAGPLDILQSRIKKDFPQYAGQFEVLNPPLSTTTVHVGFSKKAGHTDKLYDAFVKGFNQMVKDGSYAKLAKKHGIDYTPTPAP